MSRIVWPKRLGTWILLLSLALSVGYSLPFLFKISPGFNYQIYNYFSALYLDGKDPYRPPEADQLWKKASYLDFPGLQLGIYVVAKSITRRTVFNGFVLYSLCLLSGAMVTLFLLYANGAIRKDEYIYFLVLCFAAPALFFVLHVRSYEDKFIYLLAPLMLWYASLRSELLASLISGIFAGITGVSALATPVFIIEDLKAHDIRRGHMAPAMVVKILSKNCGLFFLGFVIALIPFWPDSLMGWERRMAREAADPFWFSIWNLAPEVYYTNLNKHTIIVISLAIYAALWLGKVKKKTAIILLFSLVFCFSSNAALQRTVPSAIVMVLAFGDNYFTKRYFIVAMVFLVLSPLGFSSYPSAETIKLESLGVAIPFLTAYAFVVAETMGLRRSGGV